MVHIVGGGLAGCEAAWQAASMGVDVTLYEMRPVRPTAVHQSDRLAELVCSNSLGSMLPHEHLRFMAGLELVPECGDYIFVHAGLRPGVPLAEQDPHDLLWIREPFLDHEGFFPGFVVHGHTPALQPEIRPNRICIDTGSFFTGRITAMAIEGDSYELLSSQD